MIHIPLLKLKWRYDMIKFRSGFYINNSSENRTQFIQEDDTTCYVVDLFGTADFIILDQDFNRVYSDQLDSWVFDETPIIEETDNSIASIRLRHKKWHSYALLIISAENAQYYSASFATGADKNRDSILN